jgi:glycosyltransferase involved in cell wall biosynthesis
MATPLKLLLYSSDWLPTMGGIQTITTDLANGLIRLSRENPSEAVEVTIVTQTAANGMNDDALPFRVVRRPQKLELVRLIRETDILHMAGPALWPLGLGYLLGKTRVLEHHGYQTVCPNGLLLFEPTRTVCPGHFMAGRYRECIRCTSPSLGWEKSVRDLLLTFPRRWLASKVTVNIAVSQHIGMRTQLPHTQVIYHGVPGAVAAPNIINRIDGQSPLCFAYVGRLVLEKGVPVLLRASKRLLDEGYKFQLRIVGDGPQRAELEEMSRSFGLEKCTTFLGTVTVDAVSQALGPAQVVVMPSVWEDVAPLVAIEQMMQGRLVIASDIGGLGETVTGAGLKFPPGDDGALTEQMRWVLEDPSRAREMGAKAAQIASERFTLSRMIDEHMALYQSLMHR